MASITVRNWKNEPIRDIEIPDAVFAVEWNGPVVHEVVRAYRAGLRAGTHKAKVRSEVAGAGKKLWKQKHTGRARMGSLRSPLWRKGGTVHGPVPRDHGFKVNAKVKKGALRSALSEKVATSKLLVLDRLEPEEAKTKWLDQALGALGVMGKALLVEAMGNAALERASGNNPRLRLTHPRKVEVYDVLDAEYLVVSEEALARITEVLQ